MVASGICWKCGAPCELYQCASCIAKYEAVGRKISEGVRAAWERRGFTARTDSEKAWRSFATHAVKKAVACGFLPNLSEGEYACVDCGGVATLYEHRDYTRLIDVEPVCQGCNTRRGRGVMPTVKQFDLHNNNAQASEVEWLKERRKNSG